MRKERYKTNNIILKIIGLISIIYKKNAMVIYRNILDLKYCISSPNCFSNNSSLLFKLNLILQFHLLKLFHHNLYILSHFLLNL